MKILHVNSLYYPNAIGGAERSVQALAEAQTSHAHKVTVVTLTPGVPHIGEVNGVKVHYLGLRNVYWPFGNHSASKVGKAVWHALDSYNPLMSGAIVDILEEEKPDVLHTHNLTGFSASVWPAATLHNLPVVHTLRDYSLLCPKVTMFRDGENCERQHLSCQLYSRPRTILSRRTKAVTAISQFILERHVIAGAFAGGSIREVIYNPQAPHVPTELPPATSNRGFAFGFIGQLTPSKGVGMLIEAFAKLADPACELIIAGDGDPAYVQRLREEAKGSRVRFIGFTRPEEFYPTVDVLVVPSLWHEPFGRVIVEAYSYAVPVLGSKRGGIPEIVDHLRSGILFDPDNPEELTRELRRLAQDRALTRVLGEGAVRKAKEFLPETIRAQYDSVYSRVTG